MKLAAPLNWIILLYLLIIAALSLNDIIRFGNGLGDLFFVFGTLFSSLIYLILLLILHFRLKNPIRIFAFKLSLVLFFLIAIYLSYQLTFGRGSEFPWNGNVFYRNPFG